jgi:metal iron transporter
LISLPNFAIVKLREYYSLFESSAMVGGNLMPHSLYVGSSLVHARLREFDIKENLYTDSDNESAGGVLWRPSYKAIKSTLGYTFAELIITVFIIAIFVNSAILIVAATQLGDAAGDADLFGLYDLFRTSLGQSSATIFAIGLLFSGTSAGIVATMAGQIVMEGAINLRINPFIRRLITRLIAIVPAMVIVAAVGDKGLGTALQACNVVLSIGLIFLTAPIFWYTGRSKYMTVSVSDQPQVRPNHRVTGAEESQAESADREGNKHDFSNGWFNIFWGVIAWLLIVILNVAAIALLGLGKGDDD